MKTLLCLSLICFSSLPATSRAQNYRSGDMLYVVAQSGLRLRTSPNANAGTIRILDCGESVIVTNTFGFDSHYRAKSGWFEGYWIYVRSNLGSGYVFDAFLSTLELPSHEDELSYESLHFTAPLHTYLRNHYPVLEDQQGLQSREDVDQCITFHEGGITLTSTVGEGWHKTDVAFQGYRISEVIQLFQSMIVGEDLVQAFQDSLRFHKDKHGELNKVVADTGSHRMTFEVQHGAVHVSYTEFSGV